MKILNLFAGIGGNRTLWGDKHEITAIENDQQIALIYHKRFPNDKIIITDAYQFLEDHYQDFDFIWASPDCITHTKCMFLPNHKKKLPDLRLYSLILFLQNWYNGFWIIENVISYYPPLIPPTAVIDRHFIWSNYKINNKKYKKPKNFRWMDINLWCKYLGIDRSILINFKNCTNHDPKRTLLRRCVLPEVGKYVLDCIKNRKQQSLEVYLK